MVVGLSLHVSKYDSSERDSPRAFYGVLDHPLVLRGRSSHSVFTVSEVKSIVPRGSDGFWVDGQPEDPGVHVV